MQLLVSAPDALEDLSAVCATAWASGLWRTITTTAC